MRFRDMPTMGASHLRVSDGQGLPGYSDCLFRKMQSRSSFRPGEYGTRRILFYFPWAGRKPKPRSTRIRSLGKTAPCRSVAALPFHHEFALPHPAFFCNIAFDHLISAYAANGVLQQGLLMGWLSISLAQTVGLLLFQHNATFFLLFPD